MEEKYTIKKLGIDDYVLKYREKEIKLRSSVGLAEKMQNAIKVARMKMIKDLVKEGTTIDELTKKVSKDGKTYYDNSNKDELERIYIADENEKVFNECVKEMTGMSLTDLIFDIGLTTEEEAQTFGEKVGGILTGNFPRWWL